MGAGLELGPARLGEAAQLAEMSRDLVERGFGWRYQAPVIRRYIRHPESEVVVARHAGEVVGFAIMRFYESAAHLVLLAVDPHYRRLGAGRALMRWLIDMAKVAGTFSLRLEVRQSNAGGRAFYRALGFRETARVRGYYQGRESAVRLLLDLRRS